MRRCSEGRPRSLALAPVATMSVSAQWTSSPIVTWNGRRARSTAATSPYTNCVPKRPACSLNTSISSGPDAFREAGIVLDVGRDGELAARLRALGYRRAEIRARRVQRRREPGGTGAEDEHAMTDRIGHRVPATIGSWYRARKVNGAPATTLDAPRSRRTCPDGRRVRQARDRARGGGAGRGGDAAANARADRRRHAPQGRRARRRAPRRHHGRQAHG